MKSGSRIAVQSLAAVIGVVAGIGCAEAPGELVLVVQTDLSLPEDIDTIRIEISRDGIPKYKEDFSELGVSSTFLLPATLGIVPPDDDPGATAQIRVSARSQGVVRAVREVVTQVPNARVATLHVPIEFLCLGSAQPLVDAEDNVVSVCPQGTTCEAGVCRPRELSESEIERLSDYAAAEVFGGSTEEQKRQCLDVATCFEGAQGNVVMIDPADCTVSVDLPGESLNVALVAETEGMCNGVGCLVALNAGSETGWTRLADGRIQLPPGACAPDPALDRSPVLSAVVIPVVDQEQCPSKTAAIPTCGPWSAVGNSAPVAEAVAQASGQISPSSIRFSGNAIVWTSSGNAVVSETGEVTGFNGGSVSILPLGTRDIARIEARPGLAPRVVVAADDGRLYWTEAAAMPGAAAILSAEPTGDDSNVPSSHPLPQGFDAHRLEGLAVAQGAVFWTDFGKGVVGRLPVDPGSPTILVDQQRLPFRIAAVSRDFACWTNEGSLQTPDGSVRCMSVQDEATAAFSLLDVATGQATPRALAVTADAVYWANFDSEAQPGGGQVMKATRNGATITAVEVLASDQVYPSGLAVDGDDVYWTNRGDGTVMVRRGSTGALELIAERQARPGEIALTESTIYWINEGQGATGTIMSRAK